MFKITKMLVVLVAVTALAFSATTALGSATWTGAAVGNDDWSDMANWSGDPATGGTLTLGSGSSTMNVDMPASWTIPGSINLSDHVLTVVDGGVLQQNNMYLRNHNNSTIRLTGGVIDTYSYHNPNSSNSGNFELSGGSWIRGSIYKPAEVHVIGADGTYSIDYNLVLDPNYASFWFTLEAGDLISSLAMTSKVRTSSLGTTSPLIVDGIKDYVAA